MEAQYSCFTSIVFGKRSLFFLWMIGMAFFSVMGLLKINTPEIHHVGQY